MPMVTMIGSVLWSKAHKLASPTFRRLAVILKSFHAVVSQQDENATQPKMIVNIERWSDLG